MKRALIIILTLAFIMSMAVIPVAAEAPQTGIVSGKVLSDFDKLTPMDDYADFADGTEIGADFVAGGYGSQYKIIAGDEAISGNSFGLKKWTNIFIFCKMMAGKLICQNIRFSRITGSETFS